MREREPSQGEQRPDHAAPEEADRPWSDLVHGLLHDQFREFREEARRASHGTPRPTRVVPHPKHPRRH